MVGKGEKGQERQAKPSLLSLPKRKSQKFPKQNLKTISNNVNVLAEEKRREERGEGHSRVTTDRSFRGEGEGGMEKGREDGEESRGEKRRRDEKRQKMRDR